jgi:hypothetical protein
VKGEIGRVPKERRFGVSMRGKGHLMLAIPLYVLSIKYLSRAQELLLSPFFAFYCLMAMLGALYPDVDWTIDRVIPGFGHRNPLTHSLLGPLLLYIPLFSYQVSYPLLINSYNAFTFGIATHLFGDLMKTGNFTWIKSRKQEYAWFVLNGIVLVFLLYMTEFLNTLYLGAAVINFINLFS